MKSAQYPFGLNTRAAIMAKARALSAHLDSELSLDHAKRPEWTTATFDALRSFFHDELGIEDFPSRKQANKKRERAEFLWDFLAYRKREGIYLVVESEWNQKNIADLKHDFEKLLYVHAPIKLMICKTKTRGEARELAKGLSDFAANTFQDFGPGSVLLVYCRTSKKRGQRNISFVWQCPGDPSPMSSETLLLKEI